VHFPTLIFPLSYLCEKKEWALPGELQGRKKFSVFLHVVPQLYFFFFSDSLSFLFSLQWVDS
jgi:hypothetical protein